MIIDKLIKRAESEPDCGVITWVEQEGQDGARLDCATLLTRVETLAGFLRGPCGLQLGDRVLLVYPPSLTFLEGFLACLYAGIIPVPCHPPDPRLAADVERIAALAASARVACALTDTRFRLLQRWAAVAAEPGQAPPRWPAFVWHTTDDVPTGAFASRRHAARPEDVAFLQYTSGSTSAPRGVALSFSNIDHQLSMNQRLLYPQGRGRGVFWVPQYHDLGLISGLLSSVYGNAHFHAMSPLTFLARPAVWAEVITRTQATHTSAPNFGYALLLRKTTQQQREKFDFSHLRVMMSAGEAIHYEMMEQFFAAFAVCGLRKDAFCPAYGLAEHSVGVTMGGRAVLHADRQVLEQGSYWPVPPETEAEHRVTLVGCGWPTPDVSVRIVDSHTRQPLPQGSVGEIWADSPSKAEAYDGLPEASEQLLHARLEGENDGHLYLRTGDLGLMQDGELFVTGRLKELVIIGGRNLAAPDIEVPASRASALVRPGCVAAFAVDNPGASTEAIGIVAELREATIDESTVRRVADAIRHAVTTALRVPVRTIVIGKPGLLPKTTSGKLQRLRCRQALLSGELLARPGFMARYDYDTPEQPAPGGQASLAAGSIEDLPRRLAEMPLAERLDGLVAALQMEVATVLFIDTPAELNPRHSLSSFGLDSVSLVELSARLSQTVNAPVTLAQLATLTNLHSIAMYLLRDVMQLAFVNADPGQKGNEPPSGLHRPTWQPHPESSRIAIIGGGCAGLVAARELAKRGYRHVELFEALERTGGKVYTAEHQGTPYEMGQLVFGQRYHEIFGLALEVGCEFLSEPGQGFAVDAQGERHPFRNDDATRRWRDQVFAVAGVDPEVPPERSVQDIPTALLVPLGKWLQQHGLAEVPAEIRAIWTGFGYGYLSEDVPAWYLIRCMRAIDYNTMMAVSIRGGNQRMWDGLAQKLRQTRGYCLRFEAPVSRLERTPDGVRIQVAGEAPRAFDAVLLAIPAHAAAPLLPPAERAPFDRFQYYDYRVTAFAGTGISDDVRSLNLTPQQSTPCPGRLLAIARTHGSPKTFIASQYGSRPGAAPLSDAAMDELLMADLKSAGVQVQRLLQASRWRTYFPHLSSADLGQGVLQEIESRQGRDRTFYLGSYLAFETLEHTARHAQAIVRTFF